MRICLISAPTVTDFGEHADSKRIRKIAEHPPLGILTLAAILRDPLGPPVILDSNRLYYEFLGGAGAGKESCAFVASRVEPGFDVIGLSTICSSYPLTLRIAELLKRACPNTAIILGGPQASAVDVATLKAFPFIDLIVRGEADESLLKVLQTGVKSPALAMVPGITFRSGGSIARNPEALLVADLDILPFPAFDLLPGMETLSYFPLELGRGCPFACTFCSTNDFFRRRFRLKSPAAVLAQMKRVAGEYHVKRFDLIHDMFTVDRKRVVAFCETLLADGEGFRWGCSARTDCIDDELIKLMHRAGCRGVFFGVETGSARLQRVIEKDLDLEVAAARIRGCTAAGMETTVSLITGFPEETDEDVWQTVAFLLDASRHERVEPQLHIVAPLAGTPLQSRFPGTLLLDDVYSDISYQGWKQDEEDKALIAAFPEIFPNFYGVPAPALNRPRLKRLRDFILYGLGRFRWVLAALHQTCGGIQSVFETWEAVFPGLAMSGDGRGSYYASPDFRRDFTDFVRLKYLRGNECDASLDALLRLEQGVAERCVDGDQPAPGAQGEAPKRFAREIVPILRPEVRLLDFEVDVRAVLEQLRRGDGLPLPLMRRVTIATRARKVSGTDIMELTPLSASFLKLCDSRTLDMVGTELEFDDELQSLGREQICALTFQELCRQRLVTWREANTVVSA